MADHQQTPGIFVEERHQPALGVQIEVVGWLIQDQYIGLGEQHSGKFDPAPLSPRHGGD